MQLNEPMEPGLALLWGAAAIAAEIGLTPRRCFYMLETGKLPARKIGDRWVADRTELRAFFRVEAA